MQIIDFALLFGIAITLTKEEGKPVAKFIGSLSPVIFRALSLVMSLALGGWVRDTALVSSQRDVEYKKAFLNAMTKSNSTLNTKISGMIGYDGTKYENEAKQAKELMKSFPGLFKG